MRIATANNYDSTIKVLADRQAQLAQQQERLATGKRVLRASDDPVAATLSEAARNRLARAEADQRALEASRTSLQQAESGLAESGELIQRVRDLLVTAGNAGFTDSEREDVARQLEGLREQLIAVANRTDSAGRTLFGGLGGAATPFVDLYTPSGNGVAFNGQRGQAAAGNTALPQALDGQAIWMQVPQGNGRFVVSLPNTNTGGVSTGVGEVVDPASYTGGDYRISFAEVAGQMQYTVIDVSNGNTPLASHTGVPYEPGKSVQFGGMGFVINGNPAAGDAIDIEGSPARTDIFQVVQNAVDALRYGGVNESAHRNQELARAMTEVDAGHDRVLLARGRVGELLNRADSLDTLLEGRALDNKAEDSRLTDIDLVKGISDFQTQQQGLEAAIKSYAQVQKLSLFSMIG
ncbi:MAG: flagellar hook-associated protein 3 [Comamonadaceae bacterium]|nr:flagellar hook-associated protein 3 [Comamonadaceae bacterium]